MDEKDRVEFLEKHALENLREDIDYIEGYAESAHVAQRSVARLARSGKSRKKIAAASMDAEETSQHVQQFASHAQEVLEALDFDGESRMDEEERVAQLEKYAAENLAALLAALSHRGDSVRTFGKDLAKLAKKIKGGQEGQEGKKGKSGSDHAEEIAGIAMLLKGLGRHIEERAGEAAALVELLVVQTDGPRYYVSNMTADEEDMADNGADPE